jgi:hypothetical protein
MHRLHILSVEVKKAFQYLESAKMSCVTVAASCWVKGWPGNAAIKSSANSPLASNETGKIAGPNRVGPSKVGRKPIVRCLPARLKIPDTIAATEQTPAGVIKLQTTFASQLNDFKSGFDDFDR